RRSDDPSRQSLPQATVTLPLLRVRFQSSGNRLIPTFCTRGSSTNSAMRRSDMGRANRCKPQRKSALGRQLGAVASIEMRKQRREMNFYRAFRDIEFARDFLVRKAPADAIQNVALTWRNAFRDGSAAGASLRFGRLRA